MIETREEIKMASELLINISKDEIERAHYRSRKMYLMDEEHKAAVRRDAMEALQNKVGALQNEILKNKIKAAKKLLSMSMSVDDVMETTELTRSEVEALLTENRLV
jgi:hypothetical protein